MLPIRKRPSSAVRWRRKAWTNGLSTSTCGRRRIRDHTDVSTTRFTTPPVSFVIPILAKFKRSARAQDFALLPSLDEFFQRFGHGLLFRAEPSGLNGFL